MHFIIGLGNPGEEYAKTRHNAGFAVVDKFRIACGLENWRIDVKKKSLISKGQVDKSKCTLILPQSYMNRSGQVAALFVKNVKSALNTIVVYDDIDLPLGGLRVAFGRGSGGHKGLESIIKALKTKDFVRLRVGVAPKTAQGQVCKPKGDDAVVKFLLSDFSKKDEEELKKIKKSAVAALEMIITEGKDRAMNEYN
jgi:PTH1 family peptidyl-tRNA hydrolase